MKSETVMLRFSVRDTGIGIPAGKIVRLFKEFSQVDGSTTRQYGGSGLGLSISKQLAELMGGEAGVSSEEGNGSEFWFTARFNKQAVGAHKESIPPADLNGVRALIVDDSATNREILTTRMVSWGMRPVDVKDGPDAISALYLALNENDPFCIAVIDMRMPGMDGETLGRIIHADKRLTDTRMMLLTSIGTRGDARRFRQIGFSAYATKPIQHRELKAVLSLALAGQDEIEPKPIITRHSAREKMNLFIDRMARILLAEDDITNQLVALGILKKLGLRADAVCNGAEALIALQAKPYDLVLMDVNMPVMGGFEATKRIRNYEKMMMAKEENKMMNYLPSFPSIIPIIAMTANAMHGDRELCLEAGMNDYITKPVSPQALAEVLEKWLPKDENKS
jgi:CheY-like chemotaxis protein